MPDDKQKRGHLDRREVARLENYEVEYVAKKFKVTARKVRSVIRRVGNDRRKIYAELRKRKARK